MTDKQRQVIEVIKQATPWKKVAERELVFFARYLIDTGQMPKTFVPALGKDVGPLGDACIDHHLYAPVSSIKNINAYLESLIDKEGAQGILPIKERCIKAGSDLHSFLKKSKFTNLEKDLLQFKEYYTKLTPFLLTAVFAEKMLEKKIEALIVDKMGSFDEEYFKNIVYVKDFNTTTEEMIDLLKISIAVKNKEIDFDSHLIDKHRERYSYLGVRGQFEADWTREDFVERIKEFVKKDPQTELDNILEARDKAEKKTSEFISRYKLDKKAKDLIKVTKDFVYLRTYRTEMMYGSHAFVRPLLNKVAKQLAISEQDILYLSVDEILALLKKEEIDYKSLISERKKGYYIIQYGEYLGVFANKDKKYIDDLKIFEEHKNIETEGLEIQGQTAWKGKVTGRVKIVRSEEDIRNVREGDILVAVMTFPNFVPAMERAAAFVTDEGGILCHAAIVSREMKKPCVIATKIASKVLKDGEIVEVDADHGTISIIK